MRRLITLMSAGRNRAIVIRRELPSADQREAAEGLKLPRQSLPFLL